MSEVKRLPVGWADATLTEIAQIFMGQSPASSLINNDKKGLPFFQGKTEFTNVYPLVNKYCEEPSRIAEKDDILLSVRAPVGPVNIAKVRSGFGRGLSAIRGYTGIDHKFLFYQLRSIEKHIESLGTGSTFSGINRDKVESLPINIAPQKEQIRIIYKLEELFSELDAGVKELKAAQTKLSQYRQSLLKSAVDGSLTEQWRAENIAQVQETGEQLLARILKQRREQWQQQKLAEFAEKAPPPPKNWQDAYPEPVQPDTATLPKLPDGWVWASLSQLVDLIQIGPFGSLLHKSDYIYGGIPLINPTHIKNLKIEPDYNLTITESKLSDLQKYVMSEGDIVIGRRGEMGRCALVTDKEDGWLCGTGSLFIRVLKSLNPEFYTWVLSSKRTKDFLAEFSVGTTMQNLNQKILHNIPVPLLPENEQAAASDILHSEYDRIDKQIEDIKVALKLSEAQRRNILKSAFTGQLVPQDPNDEPASVLLEKIKRERDTLAKMPKPRKPSKLKKKGDLMNTLLEVLTAEDDWIDAQDAFQKCGIVDGTSTDRIEEIYAELRNLEKSGKIQIQRQGDFDQLKLITQDVKED
ncbi:restriction endonuclease subunit S [Nitrincola tibetensis]|uniref:Restriction endonuclease subunit S n=1 Tax=Nitrincola tibetensis TaxID=2219697 RepID=A0A364NNU5_9GAMM|nr:restriction endonuclease subunit S [Nitrincola tibetensis]RAU18692.1 restriction endonuclease subunit S [Nitrincola tibetensis]